MANKKVILFAPYGQWTVHHQADAIWGAALKSRGCEAVAILCDGIFQSCPIAGKPPNADTCRSCAHTGNQLFTAMGVTTVQLRSFLTDKDFKECRLWADDLTPEEMTAGQFEGRNIGEWIRSTLHGYFLVGTLDYTNPEIAPVARDFLYNCALIQRGLLKAFAVIQPDSMICFHAMQVYYRAAFELGRSIGLPVLVHERGFIDDSFSIFQNCISIRNHDALRMWKHWENVPLENSELEQVRNYFRDREQGKNTNFSPFYDFETNASDVRHSLRIPPGGKILAMFTSGDWEVGISASHFQMAFDSQLAWMRATAKICERHNIYLVIRHHPILVKGGRIVKRFLKELFQLNLEFPNHVRVVMPYEKITSYSIIWNADLVSSFLSTTGPESMIRGIPTLCMGDSFWRPIGMDWVKSSAEYEQAILRNLAKKGSLDWNEFRHAYRYAYLFFYRLVFKFKSFGFKEIYSPDIRVKSLSELLPGVDPALDRVCNTIMNGAELHLLPSSSRLQADSQEEETFLKAELEACSARRKSLRESPSKFGPDAGVAIIRIVSANKNDDSTSIFLRSLKRSRCQSFRRIDVTFSDSQGVVEFLNVIAGHLSNLPEKFITFGTDDIQFDESVLATSLDVLFHNDDQKWAGVRTGAWICDAEGMIEGEVFTETTPALDFASAKSIFPKLASPVSLFSLVVLKTEILREFIISRSEKPPVSMEALAADCFLQFFGKNSHSPVLTIPAPMQIFYKPPEEEDFEDRDLAVLFRLSGETEKAKYHYARAIKKAPLDKSLEAEYQAMLGESRTGHVAEEIAMEGIAKYEEVHALVETVSGWMLEGQPKYLFEKVKSLPDGAIILELGANHGKSTCAMAFACKGTKKRIISIDAFCDSEDPETGAQGADFLDIWKGNLKRLGLEAYASPMRGYTHDLLEKWNKDIKLDFVFIDASHEYIDVLLDYQLVYPMVKQNGWIAFHDVEPGWPGSWRVWLEAAAPVLTEHQIVATLAAGKKVRELTANLDLNRDYKFSFSRQLIAALRAQFPEIEELFIAMERTMEHSLHSSFGAVKIQDAENIIMRMPHVFRKVLRSMLSKDAKIDGHLHFWNALCLLSEGRPAEALQEFRESTKVSFALPQSSVARYCEYLAKEIGESTSTGKRALDPNLESHGEVDVNVLGYKDEQYVSYRKDTRSFSGVADVFKFAPYIRENSRVVQLGSGGGFLLRNLNCLSKVGVEANKFARKEASNVRGIESVEKIDDLPNAWADIVISDQYLARSMSPLDDLRSIRAKIKPNGTLVFVVPHQGPEETFDLDATEKNLYTWNPMTLGNLFKLAGYEVVSVTALQHQWPPDAVSLWKSLGESGFHTACREYAIKQGSYQIRIEARNSGT